LQVWNLKSKGNIAASNLKSRHQKSILTVIIFIHSNSPFAQFEHTSASEKLGKIIWMPFYQQSNMERGHCSVIFLITLILSWHWTILEAFQCKGSIVILTPLWCQFSIILVYINSMSITLRVKMMPFWTCTSFISFWCQFLINCSNIVVAVLQCHIHAIVVQFYYHFCTIVIAIFECYFDVILYWNFQMWVWCNFNATLYMYHSFIICTPLCYSIRTLLTCTFLMSCSCQFS